MRLVRFKCPPRWRRAVKKWSWNKHLRSCDHIGHPEIIIFLDISSTTWLFVRKLPHFGCFNIFNLVRLAILPSHWEFWPKKTTFGWTHCQTSWWLLVASWIWFWGFYSRHFQFFFPRFFGLIFCWRRIPQTREMVSPCEPRGFFSEPWLKSHIFFYLSLVLVSFNIIYLSRYRTRHFGCSWTLICARVKHQTKTTSSCTSCSISQERNSRNHVPFGNFSHHHGTSPIFHR